MAQLLGKNIEGRGTIVSVGEGIHPKLNAPTWIPVQFEDGTFAVLNSVNRPLEFGVGLYDEQIRNAAKMPGVSSLATGRSHIYVDTADGRKLVIRVGWGFGREDDQPTHFWKYPETEEESS